MSLLSPEKEIIYEALYCPCIHESSYGTLSIHRTKEGAEKAIKEHKAKLKAKHDEMYSKPRWKDYKPKFAQHEDWDIAETELLP